jgi:hypothetical protein
MSNECTSTTAFEDFQENSQQASYEHFGVCPRCRKTDGYLNVHKAHWGLCDEHHTCWRLGWNLLSSWTHETEEQWHRNAEKLEGYSVVEPVHFSDAGVEQKFKALRTKIDRELWCVRAMYEHLPRDERDEVLTLLQYLSGQTIESDGRSSAHMSTKLVTCRSDLDMQDDARLRDRHDYARAARELARHGLTLRDIAVRLRMNVTARVLPEPNSAGSCNREVSLAPIRLKLAMHKFSVHPLTQIAELLGVAP